MISTIILIDGSRPPISTFVALKKTLKKDKNMIRGKKQDGDRNMYILNIQTMSHCLSNLNLFSFP